MRIPAALTLLLLPIASAAGTPSVSVERFPGAVKELPSPERCDPIDRVRMADTPVTVGAQRLIDLPPGSLDLAVSRMFYGCPESVTVAENFGSIEGPRAVKPRLEQPALPRTRLLVR